eukprot:jgi/Orpsp1_1/1191159/evm.model.d7180000083873.1
MTVRIVAKGCQQKFGEDFKNTYSPTVQSDSLRITVAKAAMKKWKLKQIDIKAAYLNAKLEEKIYMRIPCGDKNYGKNKVWLLRKALYGLKQAGRMWNNEISKFLTSIGLKQFITDKCVFGKYDKNNKLIALLTLYVDDILLTGENCVIENIMNKLKNKYSISKESDAKKIIEERKNEKPVNVNKYKSLLGSLLYIAINSRPDITYAVNQASRNCEKPTNIDYKALLMILKYLKSTIDKSIHYKGNNKILGYADADFANDEKSRRSIS